MRNPDRLVLLDIWFRTGSVSSLAKAIHITQPAATYQLKLLEEEWGGGIFLRKGKRLYLTEKGHRLLESAQEIQKTLNFLKQDLYDKEVKKEPSALMIGVSDQIERPFIVDRLVSFLQAFDPMDRPSVKLVSASADELSQRFLSDELDLLVTDTPESDPSSKLIAKINLPIHLVVSLKMGAPLRQFRDRDPVSILNQLYDLGLGMALPGRHVRLRREVEGYLDANKVERRIVFESDILATVVRAISDGIGAGILPSSYFSRSANSDKVLIFGPESGMWFHSVHFFYRKTSIRSAVLEALADSLSDKSLSL